ncbi:hypothetical protein BH09BAC4_BH09BAC4_04040 [soil metagenome]
MDSKKEYAARIWLVISLLAIVAAVAGLLLI